MKLPQLLIASFYIVVLLYSSSQHGKKKLGRENFWVTLISVSTQVTVLWFGGFFN